jgi:hypothetical protein
VLFATSCVLINACADMLANNGLTALFGIITTFEI